MFPMLESKLSALFLCVAIGASGCSDAISSNNAAKRPFTMSLTTQSQGAVAERALADITIAAGSNTLVITKAQLVARRIELAPTTVAGCAAMQDSGDDDAEAEDGCAEVEVGPALLDIPVNGSLQTSLSASVPAGTYRALEIRIRPISSGNRSSQAFVLGH